MYMKFHIFKTIALGMSHPIIIHENKSTRKHIMTCLNKIKIQKNHINMTLLMVHLYVTLGTIC